jgi:hypothetical protein
MNRIHLLLILLLAVVAVPFAAADTIQLTNTNLAGVTNIGSVTLASVSGGVMVTASANSGFSLKVAGGDILFSTNAMLTASNISQIMIDGQSYSGGFKLSGPATRGGFGPFTYDLTQLNLHGVPTATTISFVVSGVTLQDLGGAWGTHFACSTGSCAGLTGFASSGPAATVPEPGTLSLLGTGIIALAGFMRKRFFS